MDVLSAALLIVDAQVDFFPGGALPVPEADAVLSTLNAYARGFGNVGYPVFASRDWHPPDSMHFEANGGVWPIHCVQSTPGAAFHEELKLPDDVTVISKGMAVDEDGYSAFQARDSDGNALGELLEGHGVGRLYICGLALDYCVKASALDARARGLETIVLIDATRAVNVSVHDAEDAIEELVRSGVGLAVWDQIGADLLA